MQCSRWRPVAAGVALYTALASATLLLSACAGVTGTSFRPASPAALMNGMSGKYIKHVVIVVQENRTFDDLFATFPGADGATSGYYLKPTSTGYVKTPINLVMRSLAGDEDVNHDSKAYNVSCDGTDTYPKTSCQMDGFNLEFVDGHTIVAGKYPYMYVNPADITPYWTMAQQYGLSDYMFQTQGSGSFTAHLDLVAGGSNIDDPNCGSSKPCALIDYPSNFSDWGCGAPDTTTKQTVTSLLTRKGKFLPSEGPFPCLTFPTKTMRDLLDAAGVSWKYYTPAYSPGGAGALWDAFSAISDVYNDPNEWGTNVSWPETNIFNDITNNTLPAVSWIVPERNNSDHPWGKGSQDNGPSWVTSIVNAVGQSSYWDSTAIIVTWDDFGGFFDHEPPPLFDKMGGLGFRVPMLVISPYVPPNEITHTQYEFGSILKFVEQNFGLGSMHTTDQRARSMVDMFDFKQKPRPFSVISAPLKKNYFIHESHVDNQPVDDE
jgi:phospholipase C